MKARSSVAAAPLIELQSVTRDFGRRPRIRAVDAVSLAIDADTAPIVAVAGESGSGKTTLASLLLGFETPSAGHVLYRGVDIGRLSVAERRIFRREVQAVFQDPFAAYNPFWRVDHALTLPIRQFGIVDRRAEAALIAHALSQVGLNPADTLGRFPHQLSGGQRQRLMIARAILLSPRLLIADEPVSMVDASLRSSILACLRRLNRASQLPVVYITHDLTTAYHVADTILVMYRGRIVEAGPAASVIEQPAHPYTQLLVGSIAWADPDLPWGSVHAPLAAPPPPDGQGCRFAPRCPHASTACTRAVPPALMVGPSHMAACLLHQGHTTLFQSSIASVIRANAPEGATAP